MAKMCDVCGNKIGFLSGYRLKDGKICDNCGTDVGFIGTNTTARDVAELLAVQEIVTHKQNNQKIDFEQYWINYKSGIKETKEIEKVAKQKQNNINAANREKEKQAEQEKHEANKAQKEAEKAKYVELKTEIKSDETFQEKKVYLDFTKKKIFIDKTFLEDYHLYDFSNLSSYKTIETPTTITKKHGITRSVVGGLVAGPTGAVLGAVSGGKNYEAISELAVILYFNNNYYKKVTYISTATKTDTILYRSEKEEMLRFCSKLDQVLNSQSEASNTAINK